MSRCALPPPQGLQPWVGTTLHHRHHHSHHHHRHQQRQRHHHQQQQQQHHHHHRHYHHNHNHTLCHDFLRPFVTKLLITNHSEFMINRPFSMFVLCMHATVFDDAINDVTDDVISDVIDRRPRHTCEIWLL